MLILVWGRYWDFLFFLTPIGISSCHKPYVENFHFSFYWIGSLVEINWVYTYTYVCISGHCSATLKFFLVVSQCRYFD